MSAELNARFAQVMTRLGPFEPDPALAIAVSGGADSMALAVLTQAWTGHHGGSVLALVVDHGLRATSAQEAGLTIQRLSHLGIPARLLTVTDLPHGPAMAERARISRYQLLTQACQDAAILHLLLGHHAADQVETVAMRVLRGSHTHGLAGMPALRETDTLRLLRPMLGFDPASLRHLLTSRCIGWIEDPSNRDLRALRPRLREGLAASQASLTRLPQAIAAAGAARLREETAAAAELAARVTIRPEGFALLSPGRIGVAALRALIQTIGGSAYAPGLAQVTPLAAQPEPATLGGVRLLPAGRLGDGLLVVREEAAIGPDVAAATGSVWDGRFRLVTCEGLPNGTTIGGLGADASHWRTRSGLPQAILRTLPALRVGKKLAAVPHLGYAADKANIRVTLLFSPPRPLAGAPFAPTPMAR